MVQKQHQGSPRRVAALLVHLNILASTIPLSNARAFEHLVATLGVRFVMPPPVDPAP